MSKEKKLNEAKLFIKSAYVDKKYCGTESLLIGDVCELVKILTGENVKVDELLNQNKDE